MRTVTLLSVVALAAPSLLPTAAAAQAEDRRAVEACRPAVSGEVRSQFPQAYGVRLTTLVPIAQGRAEMSVTGTGEFDDRNGGAARFDYGCTYNVRSGATYALDVRNVRPIADPSDKKKKDNSAAIAGLVLGAIVVGAIAASQDDDDDRRRDRDRGRDHVWSPAAGVRCNAREAACYENGRYSRRWTNRIFVGGR